MPVWGPRWQLFARSLSRDERHSHHPEPGRQEDTCVSLLHCKQASWVFCILKIAGYSISV